MADKLKCILLVDDDEPTNYFHRYILEQSDVAENIEIAETAEEGLDLLQNPKLKACKDPELILLDLNMPGMNGWDFIEEYKKMNKDSVIVILTTSQNPDDEKMAKGISSVAGFRNKPLTGDMIREIIDKYLRTKQN